MALNLCLLIFLCLFSLGFPAGVTPPSTGLCSAHCAGNIALELQWPETTGKEWKNLGKNLGKNQTGLAAGSWMGKPWLESNRSHGADPSKQEETSDLERGADPSCFHLGKDGVGRLTSSDLLFTITLKRF